MLQHQSGGPPPPTVTAQVGYAALAAALYPVRDLIDVMHNENASIEARLSAARALGYECHEKTQGKREKRRVVAWTCHNRETGERYIIHVAKE